MFKVYYCTHFLAIIHVISCDCGVPGYSRLSFFTGYRFKNETYPENYRVSYKCSKGILVGPSHRTCQVGRWSQSIPKCATELRLRQSSDQKRGNDIYLHFDPPAAVVGFKIGIYRPPRSYYGQPVYNKYHKNTYSWHLVYTRLFGVDMSRGVNITSVNVTYAVETGYAADYGSVILYHLNEWVDDCEVPDASLHSTLSVTSDSFGRNATMSCNKGFKQSVGSVTCPTNGDWRSYENVVACDRPTCKNFTAIGVEYRPELVNNLAAIGTKAYYKCKNYDDIELGDGHNYVQCIESGDWQGKLEPCISHTGSFVNTHSNSIIPVTIVTVTIIVLGIYLITKMKNRPTTNITAHDSTTYINDDENICEPVKVAAHLQHFYP